MELSRGEGEGERILVQIRKPARGEQQKRCDRLLTHGTPELNDREEAEPCTRFVHHLEPTH